MVGSYRIYHHSKSSQSPPFLTHHPLDKMVAISQRMFTGIFVKEKFCILIEVSLKFVPKGSIDNNPALIQIIAWRRIGDKPSSEPMLTGFTDAYIRYWQTWGKAVQLRPIHDRTLAELQGNCRRVETGDSADRHQSKSKYNWEVIRQYDSCNKGELDRHAQHQQPCLASRTLRVIVRQEQPVLSVTHWSSFAHRQMSVVLCLRRFPMEIENCHIRHQRPLKVHQRPPR